MPRVTISTEGRSLLDIGSYARPGPHRRDRLSTAQLELITRTVHRTPEVMVKVLIRGEQNLRMVRRHFSYLSRGGDLEIETDDGRQILDPKAGSELIEDWDLDLERDRRRLDLNLQGGRRRPKLVHKILFSMPPGTPPGKVLEAVRNFAREEFGLKHRYAMVLHTDEPHPHVHVVVKAMSEQQERLNIRKSTLRIWRSEFARQLRALGVPANATDRQVRGVTHPQKSDGIYRAMMRVDSSQWRNKEAEMSRALAIGRVRREPGKARPLLAQEQVLRGWGAVAADLELQGLRDLAKDVRRFVARLPVASMGSATHYYDELLRDPSSSSLP